MIHRKTKFHPVRLSLTDIVGRQYAEAVCRARSSLTGESQATLRALASRKVDFFPPAMQRRLLSLLPRVGKRITRALTTSAAGATSEKFRQATHAAAAPLSGLGCFRVGEDGRLYLLAKSEHYHAPLGHSFPGYRLVDAARRLGVPNAAHNNTRGHITRLLEEELLRAAGGERAGEGNKGDTTPSSADGKQGSVPTQTGALTGVLNLETGSLAVEAALKMILSRFYRLQEDSPPPKYAGRVPVLLVMADDRSGPAANYHGTTILAQSFRGLWRDLAAGWEKHGLLRVRPVRPNDVADLEAAFRECERPPNKVAGFVHEFVLMNYGGRRLSEMFVRRAYALCYLHDTPALADEIQTGLWSPQLFMFREYGVQPAMVAIGKGFPGGEYPASRLLFSAEWDCLPQFGALVTNGQEELASLSYLVTMRWAAANADVTAAVGDYYQERLHELAREHPAAIACVEGSRHMGGVAFHELAPAREFARRLNEAGLDISVQAYKSDCPPCGLTKLPLIAGYEVIDFIVNRMREALEELGKTREKLGTDPGFRRGN